MSDLDLNLLRVLEAMFEKGSVSAAAASLGVTQPSVSISLRRLRAHFGDELFVRHGGRMLPTAKAETLRDPVTTAMGTIRASVMRAAPFAPSTSGREFVVCLSDLGDLTFLPDLIGVIRDEAPSVSIRSITVEPHDLIKALGDGSIDLAIGHLTDLDTHRCYEQTLFGQSFVCLVRHDHPDIDDRISLAQFASAEHAVVAQNGRSQELFERRVTELGIKRKVVLRSSHFMSVPFLVAQSNLITVVPLAVGRIYSRLLPVKLLEVPFDVPTVELKQFWHVRSHTDPACVWLRQRIAALFVGSDPTSNPDSPFWTTFLQSL